ncbi:MAG: DUF1573 domain-containing protein [Bacteroidota bacterium]|nr:DUF1573 domain-containing protein [Bacteroidota bacterium]MDP3555893.1 DUF1573 domain-containing protein [Bacteroidota bacterium]
MKINITLNLKNPLGLSKGIFCFNRVLFYLLFIVTSVCSAQAKMEIKDAKKNFGIVKKGEIIKLEYSFTNIGNQPLLISEAEVSCSCTTVDFPKQPVAPNQSGVIVVNFDTKTVYDRQDRVVLLKTNDPKSPAKIRYKGIVLRK